jgi:putative inorganic carbon (HCO3(-)) transporter
VTTASISSLRVLAPASEKVEYGFAFWCLVFFTFIVLVAPQAVYGFLQPLHLARVSAILALAAYVYQRVSQREALLPKTPEIRLLGLFIFLAALSIPYSLWPGGSFGLLTDFYAKSLIVFLLMAQLLTTIQRFQRMLWFVLIFCTIVSFTALAGYQQGDLVGGYRMQGGLGGLTSNPNDFALTINLFLPFAFAFYTLSPGRVRKSVCIIFVVSAVAAIMFTYSRAGFITLAVVLAICFWKMVGRGGRLKYIFPFLLVGAAFLLLAPQDYMDRLQSITDFSKDKSGSGEARQVAIEKTLVVISEHPILGVGMGMNVLALVDKGVFWSGVHNVYLQIASEIGVLGAIVFVLLIIRLFKSVRLIQTEFKEEHKQQELVVLAGAAETSLLAFCIAALFHPVAYHFYFYYIAGFVMALKAIAGRNEPVVSHVESAILAKQKSLS